MHIYLNILLALYLVIAVVIAVFVVWNVIRTKRISDKVIGVIVLIMFVLRILMLK